MDYKYTNSLINEKSPYLLQHSHNPVNWYSWSEDAFTKAKNEDKPIFLSIGYSTCHWCHVMERESFEDIQVAKILNDNFISIKVDREERPDIDSIYMNVCQSLTRSGGWPLTIFLDSNQRPFFAGTYFPKNTSFNQKGLIDILNSVSHVWNTNRHDVLASSENITNAIKNESNTKYSQDIDNDILNTTFQNLIYSYDPYFGGFGTSPKFPMPTNLYFLLRYYSTNKDKQALSILSNTLECMYRGGIYDHIGFGFSRYSTDSKWLVPHFEKMLYDNSLLSIIYSETYQLTKNALFSKISNDIFTYIIRDMLSPEGGFYSAEDADSDGKEGKFYVWTYDEILKVLGRTEGEKFCDDFNITMGGNFDGKNIPNLINSKGLSIDSSSIFKLFEYRNKRIHPHKDDKILTSWNGLMIASLSIGGKVFGNNDYIISAKNAVRFIYTKLFNSNGRLLARYRDGDASILAYSDDYAFLIWGLIELYETTFDFEYLQKAIDLNEELIRYFWDENSGGLFLYGSDSEQLITRPKELYDGVIPSSNSVSTLNWLRLSRLVSDPKLEELAEKQFKTFGSLINSNPTSCTYMLSAYLFKTSVKKEVVIIGEEHNLNTKEMIDILNSKFSPYTTTIFKDAQNNFNITKLLPHLSDYTQINNLPTAYICENNKCNPPTTDISDFENML